MNSQYITTKGNSSVKTFVLKGETVDSLLQDFVNRSNQTLNEEQLNKLKEQISLIIPLIKVTSPLQVEQNETGDLKDKVKSIFSILNDKQNTVDDFFNTLNLCVVALGTRLRGNAI